MSKKALIFMLTCFCLQIAICLVGCNTNNTFARQERFSAEKALTQITLTRLASRNETGKFAFEGIALLEDGEIWSVGYDGENPRRVRHSTNGGKTWEVTMLSPEFNKLDAIYFLDNSHGWASGTGDIFKTSDSGKNWEKTSLNRYLSYTMLNFYNQEIGYLAGKHNIEGEEASEIWVTRDGGETWKKSYESKKWQNPFSILAVSTHVALAILDNEYIIRTEDGGKTWEVVNSLRFSTDLSMGKDGKVWLVGRDGVFLYSLDEGRTWQRPDNLPDNVLNHTWNDIAFVNSQLGFAVGDNAAMAVTEDGGHTWKRFETGVRGSLSQTSDVGKTRKEIESEQLDHLKRIQVNQEMGVVKGADYVYKLDF